MDNSVAPCGMSLNQPEGFKAVTGQVPAALSPQCLRMGQDGSQCLQQGWAWGLGTLPESRRLGGKVIGMQRVRPAEHGSVFLGFAWYHSGQQQRSETCLVQGLVGRQPDLHAKTACLCSYAQWAAHAVQQEW